MHQLANLPVLCNMQSNVLNDLAKAKRRWTEKNCGSEERTEDSSAGPLCRQRNWIVHCAQQIYTGTAASDSQALLDRPRK